MDRSNKQVRKEEEEREKLEIELKEIRAFCDDYNKLRVEKKEKMRKLGVD